MTMGHQPIHPLAHNTTPTQGHPSMYLGSDKRRPNAIKTSRPLRGQQNLQLTIPSTHHYLLRKYVAKKRRGTKMTKNTSKIKRGKAADKWHSYRSTPPDHNTRNPHSKQFTAYTSCNYSTPSATVFSASCHSDDARSLSNSLYSHALIQRASTLIDHSSSYLLHNTKTRHEINPPSQTLTFTRRIGRYHHTKRSKSTPTLYKNNLRHSSG